MIGAASELLNVDRDTILESFGEFIAPELLRVYRPYIKADWDCMKLLENIETAIHKAVMNNTPDAAPPKLKITRIDEDEIQIEYTSPRKMIALGIGIIKKIAEHYQETLQISQLSIVDGILLTINRQK